MKLPNMFLWFLKGGSKHIRNVGKFLPDYMATASQKPVIFILTDSLKTHNEFPVF
jgi:hypothetical protein